MVTSQPRAAVVYHPLKTDVAALRSAVLRHEARAGWAPSIWHETSEDDAGQAVTKLALATEELYRHINGNR